jgi:transposase
MSDRTAAPGSRLMIRPDLLKLYLYGYLHQVRSSRRLEREVRRNVELMWLLRGLAPGYRTIANFRKQNAAGLKAANRDFVLLARSLDLLGGTLVAIEVPSSTATLKRRWPDLAHRPGRPAVGQARADRRRLQCADRG